MRVAFVSEKALFLALLFVAISMITANAQDQNMLRKYNLSVEPVATENGKYLMAFNTGLRDGSNNEKIFGKGKPTTLWSNKRRASCYAMALRMIAQMPAAQGGVASIETIQGIFESHSGWMDHLSEIIRILSKFNTNYVKNINTNTAVGNKLTKFLRTVNPKSHGGVPVKWKNLGGLAKAIKVVAVLGKISEFTLAAAIQQSLSGDLSRARLGRIQGILDVRSMAPLPMAERMDSVLMAGFAPADSALDRSKEYWGAMLTVLFDRSGTLFTGFTAEKLIQVAHKQVLKTLGKGLPGKITPGAGIQAFALIATVETIIALFEQHEQAQVGVAASTIAYLLDREIAAGRIEPDDALVQAMIAQAEAVYCAQMVSLSSGFPAMMRDLLTPGHDYREVADTFRALQLEAEIRARRWLLGDDFGRFTDVTVGSSTITLSFWDHAVIDGDIIDLDFGGRKLLDDHVLEGPPGKSITVELLPGPNTIVLTAVSTGRLFPNTATLRISDVIDGKDEQTWSVGLHENATLRVNAPN